MVRQSASLWLNKIESYLNEKPPFWGLFFHQQVKKKIINQASQIVHYSIPIIDDK